MEINTHTHILVILHPYYNSPRGINTPGRKQSKTYVLVKTQIFRMTIKTMSASV